MAVVNTSFEEMFGKIESVPPMPIVQESIIVIEEGADFKKGGEHPIVILCIDTSGSMRFTDSASGESRIDLVKKYAKDFVNTDVISPVDKEKVELCVITFDDKVTIYKDFAPMSEISDDFSALRANGYRATYSALVVAVMQARKRRNLLSASGIPCYKPIIFLLSDGHPEQDDEMRESCRKVLHQYVDKDENGKAKMRLFICGMGQCDMQEMNALCDDKQIIGLADTDALKEAFQLMNTSVADFYAAHTVEIDW